MRVIFVAITAANAATARRQADRVYARYLPYLPEIFDPEPRRWRSGRGIEVVFWVKRSASANPAQELSGQRLFLMTGYTTSDAKITQGRDAWDCYQKANGWGGIGAYLCVNGSTGRVRTWSTRPQVDPIFYSNDHPDLSVVSNRPIAASLAASLTPRPAFRRDFLSEAIAAGYSLSFSTPYDRIYRCPPQRALVATPHRAEVVDHPLPLPAEERLSLQESTEIYAAALVEAIAGVRGNACSFRLSGGKDSRLVAALAHHLGLDLPAVTGGSPLANEVQVARRVAETCGLDHSVMQPKKRGRKPLAGIKRINRLTEGLGLIGSDYQQTIGYNPSVILLTGQGELHKGGWSYSSRGETSARAKLVKRLMMNRFYSEDVLAFNRDQIGRWMDAAGLRDCEVKRSLYWANHDWRLSHWYGKRLMQWNAYYLDTVAPLIDDRVTAALSRIPLKYKDDESLLFATCERFSPEAARVPLHKMDWKVKGGTGAPKVPLIEIAARSQPDEGPTAHKQDAVKDDARIARYLLNSHMREDLASAFNQDMMQILEKLASGERKVPIWKDASQSVARNMLWRTAGLVALYEEGLDSQPPARTTSERPLVTTPVRTPLSS